MTTHQKTMPFAVSSALILLATSSINAQSPAKRLAQSPAQPPAHSPAEPPAQRVDTPRPNVAARTADLPPLPPTGSGLPASWQNAAADMKKHGSRGQNAASPAISPSHSRGAVSNTTRSVAGRAAGPPTDASAVAQAGLTMPANRVSPVFAEKTSPIARVGAAGEMIGFTSSDGSGSQTITLVHTGKSWMAVYHIDRSGTIQLVSSRPIDADFALQLNATSPLPDDIREMGSR